MSGKKRMKINLFKKFLHRLENFPYGRLFFMTAFSGFLMAFPYYIDALFFLPLFAFAPFALFLLDERFSKPWVIILASFFYVFFYYAPLINWLSTFNWSVYPLLIFFYYPAIHAIASLLIKKLLQHFYPLRLLIVPSVLLIMEHFKIFGFLGFSLGIAGYSLHKFTAFIQIANVFGIYGVTFILYFLNTLLADFLLSLIRSKNKERQKPKIGNLFIFLVIFILILAYGFFSIHSYKEAKDKHLRISLIQPWFDYNQSSDRKHSEILLDKIKRLTALAAKEEPDVVAYPENAWPSYYKNTLDFGRSLELKTMFATFNKDLPDNKKMIFFLGSTYSIYPNDEEWKKILSKDSKNTQDSYTYQNYETLPKSVHGYTFNAYHKINSEGLPIQDTFKKILVPFGESVPTQMLRGYLEEKGLFYSYDRGSSMDIFNVKDIRVGILICFEDFFSSFVNTYNQLKPDFYLVPANNAWSYYLSAGILQNNASVFRAIESGKPIVSVTNAGITSEINPLGITIKELPQFEEGLLTLDLYLPKTPPKTLYQTLANKLLLLFYCFIFYLLANMIFRHLNKNRLSHFNQKKK